MIVPPTSSTNTTVHAAKTSSADAWLAADLARVQEAAADLGKAQKASSVLGACPLANLVKVQRALKEDARCRHPGVTDGLYPIEDLRPFTRLSHGVPMIRYTQCMFTIKNSFARAADSPEFRSRLHLAAPYITGFDLRAHGLCLAGGAASAVLMNSPELLTQGCLFHDLDFFAVGHKSDDDARNAIKALGRHLAEQWGAGRTIVNRTQGCITFTRRRGADVQETDVIVQVILRRYSTKGEVIHGFDLGSSAVLWDGEHVITTALGKLAFENGANVLNLQARRNSYEKRLARYFNRGFDLVLPRLDGLALREQEGRLPYLFAQFTSILNVCACGTELTATWLIATRPGYDNTGKPTDKTGASPEPCPASDYEVGQITYDCDFALTAQNARALSGDKLWTASLCASAQYTGELDIFAIEPVVCPDILAKIVAQKFGKGGLKIKSLIAILGIGHATELVLASLAEGGRPPSKEMILRHCVEWCSVINERASIPFAFMTVEDKTALTGPFPRNLVTAEDWYGSALSF